MAEAWYRLENTFYRDAKVRRAARRQKLKGFDGLVIAGFLAVVWAKAFDRRSYYLEWDEEARLDFAEDVYTDRIDELAAECVAAGLFDGEILERYGVLTSRGLQERFRENALKNHRSAEIDERLALIGDSVKVSAVFPRGDDDSREVSEGSSEIRANSQNFARSFSGSETDSQDFARSFSGSETDSQKFARSFSGSKTDSQSFATSFSGSEADSLKVSEEVSEIRADSQDFARSFLGSEANSQKFAASFSEGETDSQSFATSFSGGEADSLEVGAYSQNFAESGLKNKNKNKIKNKKREEEEKEEEKEKEKEKEEKKEEKKEEDFSLSLGLTDAEVNVVETWNAVFGPEDPLKRFIFGPPYCVGEMFRFNLDKAFRSGLELVDFKKAFIALKESETFGNWQITAAVKPDNVRILLAEAQKKRGKESVGAPKSSWADYAATDW